MWLENVPSQGQRVASDAIRARNRQNLISILFRCLLGEGLGGVGLVCTESRGNHHYVWAGVAGSGHRGKRTHFIYILETELKWIEDRCRGKGKENPDDSHEIGISSLMAGDTTCRDRGDRKKRFVERGLRVGWPGRWDMRGVSGDVNTMAADSVGLQLRTAAGVIHLGHTANV